MQNSKMFFEFLNNTENHCTGIDLKSLQNVSIYLSIYKIIIIINIII